MCKKGDKFIIEISEECNLVAMNGEKGYAIKNTNLYIGEHILKCLERYDEVKKAQAAYRKGLADAWDVARQIINAGNDGYSQEFKKNIFGGNISIAEIFDRFTIFDLTLKVKDCEKKKKAEEEIKVGDEVLNGNIKGAVVKVWNSGVELMTKEMGILSIVPLGNIKKTGRHFPQIAEVLEKMREGKN